MKRQPPTYILDQLTHESRGHNPNKYYMIFDRMNIFGVTNSYSVEIRSVKYEKEEHGNQTRIVEVTRVLDQRWVTVDSGSNNVYKISALLHGHGDDRILDSYANALWWDLEIVNDVPGLYAEYFPEEYKAFRDQVERQRMMTVKEVMES